MVFLCYFIEILYFTAFSGGRERKKMKDECYSLIYPEKTISLHCMPVNCGHQCVSDPSYIWDGMKRGSTPMVIWQYTLRGKGALRRKGTLFSLTRGDVFFVRVPDEHIYYFPEDSEEWEFLFVTLYGSEAIRLGEEILGSYGEKASLSSESRSVKRAWELLQKAGEKKLGNRFQASGSAYDFLLSFLSDLEEGNPWEKKNLLLEKVNEYLYSHVSSEIKVSDIAGYCNYSRSHFSRLFHQTTARTIQEYIMDFRLRMAVNLLQTRNLSIKEIAGNCGFNDPSYFCRVFRKKKGITPDSFRNPN